MNEIFILHTDISNIMKSIDTVRASINQENHNDFTAKIAKIKPKIMTLYLKRNELRLMGMGDTADHLTEMLNYFCDGLSTYESQVNDLWQRSVTGQ